MDPIIETELISSVAESVEAPEKSVLDMQFDLLPIDEEGASLLCTTLNANQGQLCLITLNEHQEVISTQPIHYEVESQADGDKVGCDALELAMQEIGQEAEVLEQVSYDVKMAALKAMVPHFKKDSVNDSVTCELCSKSFSKKNDLKNHLCQHLGLQLSLCFYCGRQFTNISNLNRHLRIHTGEKPFVCKICGKRFRQTTTLHIHNLHVHGSSSRNHGCPSCGRLYKSVYLLKRHCRIAHKNENLEIQTKGQSGEPQKRLFYCGLCGDGFPLKAELKKHTQEIHQKEEARNQELEAEIEEIYSVLDEIGANEKAKEIPDENEKLVRTSVDDIIEEVILKMNSFICFHCGKQLHKFVSYKQHWGVHDTSLRNYTCQDCGVSFAWRTTLNSHIAKNHKQENGNENNITCEEPGCGRKYNSRKQMMEHVKRDHQLVRRFKCDQCSKSFFKSHDLLVHQRTHSQEKPYICSTCGKSFSHLSHVIRHERVHKNIRPYVCPLCGKTFSQASVLKNHRKNKCPDPKPSEADNR